MAGEALAVKNGEGKEPLELGIAWDNSEQAKWECESALHKLNFLIKMLKPTGEDDEADLTLRYYERDGLASVLNDAVNNLYQVWSEVLAPLSSYMEKVKEKPAGA